MGLHSSHFTKPLIALLLWMAFVGASVWQHAQRSDQPPIYDASSYYLKAHNFWTSMHGGKPFNPLDVEPTFRPPGTVLMSYPFGFDTDYRGFYFRSVFIPILLLVTAVVVAGYGRDLSARSAWLLALVAGFLGTSLPALYYSRSYWGLVDNFLAGMAALATAASVRSIGSRSWTWVLATACISGFCAWIKPTGLLVMVLVDAAWFGLAILRLRSEAEPERRRTVRWFVSGLGALAVVHVLVIALSMSSGYLSMGNLAYGSAAVGIMKTERTVTWEALRSMLQMGPGYVFVVWLVLSVLLFGTRLSRLPAGSTPWNRTMPWGMAVASGLTMAFGVWFWIFGSGGISQFRYGFPFVMMAVVLTVPVMARLTDAMRPWEFTLLSLPMAAAMVNMGALLAQANPSIEWQRWTGVDLSSGAGAAVTVQARDFASTVKRDGRDVVVYSMPLNATDAAFQAAVDYSRIANPPVPAVTTRRPVDWQRPTAFRAQEMLGADYWLFEPVRDRRVADDALAMASIDTFEQERAVFQAWATQLTESDGVVVFSETPTARVLRIVDRDRLGSAIDALIDGHRWRAVFNVANPKRHWTEQDLAAALAASPPSLEHVRFGGQIELRALSVARTGMDTTARIWWKPLPGLKERDWVFFVHSIDDDGNIVLNNQIPLDLGTTGKDALRSDAITFANAPRKSAARLAVGFYRADGGMLAADTGTRDWNGTRVIVAAP